MHTVWVLMAETGFIEPPFTLPGLHELVLEWFLGVGGT